MNSEIKSDALSVSSALAIAKRQLEQLNFTIIGEVSELSSNASYKAVYFTIKDESSALPCMMWTNKYRACDVELKIGSLVEIKGRFSLYAAKGRMNFSVDSISLAGEGDLRLRVANLAKKLEAEGLMHPSAKKPLPSLPLRIGLVTSPNGAAVYDVLRTLRRRFPVAKVFFAGVKVEGQDAPASLMSALALLDQQDLDVILLVRGGGSFEDLMPFNDEGLARHIASMLTPVVTGIGHEPDTSIADMVADHRASTPTAAAEAISPNKDEIFASLDNSLSRLDSALKSRVKALSANLAILRARPAFSDPQRVISEQAQALDSISEKLESAIPRSFEKSYAILERSNIRLFSIGKNILDSDKQSLNVLKKQMRNAGTQILVRPKEKVGIASTALSSLSPLAILSRGYSYAYRDDGKIIDSIEKVEIGSEFSLMVSDGTIDCTINDISCIKGA